MTLLETALPGFPLHTRGKVRDVYQVGYNLLIVATDRLSAFDVVLPTGIPDKGRILTQLTLYWLNQFSGIVPNHLITAKASMYPVPLQPFRDQLEDRSMLVRPLQMVPIECVVRGYLSGSAWKEYQESGSVCGIALPLGLHESDQLPAPIFTPARKAASGHDENVTFATMAELIESEDLAAELREISLTLYRIASDHAAKVGILVADTKFEFGLENGRPVLADEVLTPDSSRFWPAAEYQPGRPQRSFDKQYVRDYLLQLEWNQQPPAPALPDAIVQQTRERYLEAYRLLTGKQL